jgi:hypothetical protein
MKLKKKLHNWWWRTQFEIPWPQNGSGAFSYSINSKEIETWMVKCLGKRGWNWDWKLIDTEGPFTLIGDQKRIRFKLRRGKDHQELLIKLKWC